MKAHIEDDLRLSASGTDDRVESRVRLEQARLFWSQCWLLIGLGGAVGVSLVAAQWAVLEAPVLLGWLGLLILVSLLWGTAALIYRGRRPTLEDANPWLGGAAVATLAYGLTWSVAAFQLFPAGHFPNQAMLTVMFAGISAGAITVLSSISVTGVAFVIPALLPLGYQFALSGTTNAQLILAMLLVFLLTLVMANRHLYTTLRANIRLRIEKSMSEAALHESEARYRLMFNQSPLGTIHYDPNGVILDCNDTLIEIFGSSRKEVVGTSMIADTGDPKMASAVRTSLKTGWGYYEDTYEPVSGIHKAPLRAFFNAIQGPDENCLGGVAIVEDFTQRKQAEEALERGAYYDGLTGLPNRRLLADRLKQALKTAHRHGRTGALVFLDVDHFKRINDRLGHTAGDQVLTRVAERLMANVREEDTVARLSGDEFILLLPEIASDRTIAARSAQAVCDKLRDVLQESIETDNESIRLSASLGITLFPDGNAPADEILRQSDTAMYRAKRELRGEVRFYDAERDECGRETANLEHDLRFALEREELVLQYQPIVEADGTAVGAEALLRWQHPERGLVPPDHFIPLAEENGQIIPIGRWVFAEACRRLKEFDDPAVALPIAVNVSAQEFHHTGFARHVEDTLERTGIDGRRIIIEVTESVLIDRVDATIDKMTRLRQRGISFALDDFGTGYSSLTYLKRLPVDTIKIDRSFVSDIDTDPADAAIVEGIIAMAGRLRRWVVAEGVESGEQAACLADQGCTRFQGFYWGRPGRLEAITSDGDDGDHLSLVQEG